MLTATIIDGDLIVYDYWAKHLELFDCVNEIENTYNEKGDIRSKVIIENTENSIKSVILPVWQWFPLMLLL